MANSRSESDNLSTLKPDTTSLRFKTGDVPVPDCGSLYDQDNKWFVEKLFDIAGRDEQSLRNVYTENDGGVFEIGSDGAVQQISNDPDICRLVEALKLDLSNLSDLQTSTPYKTGPAHQTPNKGKGPALQMADEGPVLPSESAGQWANEEE
jgi:hypothetical protein